MANWLCIRYALYIAWLTGYGWFRGAFPTDTHVLYSFHRCDNWWRYHSIALFRVQLKLAIFDALKQQCISFGDELNTGSSKWCDLCRIRDSPWSGCLRLLIPGIAMTFLGSFLLIPIAGCFSESFLHCLCALQKLIWHYISRETEWRRELERSFKVKRDKWRI